jgi:hypothetical protein
MSPDRAASILARFTAAQTTLLTRLREMPPGAAQQRADEEHWSAAQLGCHVALTNELVASVITGVEPMAKPAPPGFEESFAGGTTGMVKVFPTLQPPDIVGRDAALERLRLSGQRLSKAIASLTPERGSGYVVALPFGTLSLFELAAYTADHVARHASYVERPVVRA